MCEWGLTPDQPCDFEVDVQRQNITTVIFARELAALHSVLCFRFSSIVLNLAQRKFLTAEAFVKHKFLFVIFLGKQSLQAQENIRLLF